MKKLMLILPAVAAVLISAGNIAPARAYHDGWRHGGWGGYHGGYGGYRAYGWGWGHHRWCGPVGCTPGYGYGGYRAYGYGAAPFAPGYGRWGYGSPARLGTVIRPWY